MAARAFGDQQVGGVALVVDQGQADGNQLWGLLAVLLATAAWGADNTLSRALAEREPGHVVLGKALLGASATTILALAFGDRRDYALFSVTPPATPRWEVHKLDPEGRNALHTFLQSDTRRFGGLLRQLKMDAATAIRQPQGGPSAPGAPGGRETLVVPGKVVRVADAFY